MPEETIKPNITPFPDAEKHNAEVAAKLAAQDIMANPNNGKDMTADAGDALDVLMKAAESKANGEPTPEEKAAAEKAAAEAAAAQTPEQKAAAEKAAADKAAQDAVIEADRKRAEELFKDSPQLAPNASPKSSDAFNAVKVKAAQEISSRDAEIEKLRAEKAEMEKKLQNAAPPEALKELKEHREWRAKLDVDADPKFKEFDKQISQANEFIYAQLLKSPVINKSTIDEIKKHGGADKIDFTKIFAAINDPMTQRLVETKVAEIAQAEWAKNEAIKSVKANIGQYLTQREQESVKSATIHNEATRQQFTGMVDRLEWFKPRQAASNATEAEKKSVAEHNAFVETTSKQLSDALNDDSPQMRAIMLTGMAQLFWYQKNVPTIRAENDGLKKQVAELTAKLDKFKGASVNRLRESGAAPGANPKVVSKENDIFHKPATQALDDIARQVMEERAAKANGA